MRPAIAKRLCTSGLHYQTQSVCCSPSQKLTRKTDWRYLYHTTHCPSFKISALLLLTVWSLLCRFCKNIQLLRNRYCLGNKNICKQKPALMRQALTATFTKHANQHKNTYNIIHTILDSSYGQNNHNWNNSGGRVERWYLRNILQKHEVHELNNIPYRYLSEL